MLHPERVTVVSGINPVIFIAPHCDDINTGLIAEIAANKTKGYAVINNGWKRSKEVNQKNDEANCNDVNHCLQSVVKEEFLDPIIRFKNRILKKFDYAFILYLHGVGNHIKNLTADPSIGYIIGYGAGNPNSMTCNKWVRDCFIYTLSSAENCHVYEGRKGGNYAGWARSNMNQFFTKWYEDDRTQSMQVEIINELRDNVGKANTTAEVLSICVEELFDRNHFELPELFTRRKV